MSSKDVATLAGVSQSTVSLILSGNKKSTFAEDTVRRVLAAAEELHYQARPLRRLTEGKKQIILIMCPNLTNQYYIQLIEAIQERARELGYHVLVNETYRNEAIESDFMQMVGNMLIAGVIFTYQPAATRTLQWLDSQLPVVLMYDKSPTLDIDIVELNSTKLGMLVAEHLINLGHRRIAYISTPLLKEQRARRKRLEGMELKFAEYGISIDNIVVCTSDGEGIPSGNQLPEYETGYKVAEKIVGKYDITALVGTNDMVAVGIMDALLDAKYRIPQDYSVCGVDNTSVSKLRSVSLTSVEHFGAQKGKEAVDILIRKIERGNLDEEEVARVIRVEYSPKLIARNSTGVCKRDKR